VNTKKYFSLLLLLTALLVFASSLLQKPDYSPDDTFIYMQYAKNIASGNGFSFNAGEPSYGVTSPLWVLFLTIPYLFGMDGFWFAKSLDLICALISIFVFFRLTRFFFKDNNTLRYLAVLLFTLNPWFIRWAFTGMETSFAVLLVILLFYLYYSGRFNLMFFLLGIFYLVRPESFVLSIVLFLCVVYKQIKGNNFSIIHTAGYLLLFFAAVTPFMIYAYISFGTFLPNTALGKSTLTFSSIVIFTQLREIFKTLSAAGIIEMFLTLVFVIFALKRKDFRNTAPFFLWIVGLIFLYVVTDADIISRYLLIISPFLIITGLYAVEQFPKHQLKIIIVVSLGCIVFTQFIFYTFVKPGTDDFTKGVNECLIPAGRWLSDNTGPGSKILVNDVGAIGYYANRYIIDAAALINRDVNLNRQIMKTPVEERMSTYNLLKIVDADYIIERDTSEFTDVSALTRPQLELKLTKKFPSLGIRDSSPRYYKIYKVIK